MGKILLAEDEAVIRMLLTDVLAEAGHEVIEAPNGAKALALLSSDVSVIVSDVMMPEMSGTDWVAAARDRPGMDAVPVIFMSAVPLPAAAAPLASFFLAKPFSPATLVRAVDRILGAEELGEDPEAGE